MDVVSSGGFHAEKRYGGNSYFGRCCVYEEVENGSETY